MKQHGEEEGRKEGEQQDCLLDVEALMQEVAAQWTGEKKMKDKGQQQEQQRNTQTEMAGRGGKADDNRAGSVAC